MEETPEGTGAPSTVEDDSDDAVESSELWPATEDDGSEEPASEVAMGAAGVGVVLVCARTASTAVRTYTSESCIVV